MFQGRRKGGGDLYQNSLYLKNCYYFRIFEGFFRFNAFLTPGLLKPTGGLLQATREVLPLFQELKNFKTIFSKSLGLYLINAVTIMYIVHRTSTNLNLIYGAQWYFVALCNVQGCTRSIFFHFVRFQNHRSISIYFVCFLTELISIVQQNRSFSKDTRFYFCWILKRYFFHISERSISFVHRFFFSEKFISCKKPSPSLVVLCGALWCYVHKSRIL